MNGQDEMIQQQGTPNVQPVGPGKPKGIPKIVWYIGGGCLLLLCGGTCVAVLAYLGITFLGGDPITSVVPNDSVMYMNIDFTKTQSEEFNNVADILQDVAEVDEKQSLSESMDEMMADEFGMSFTEDVLPWIGRYGSFVVTDGDLNSGDAEYMLIVEARNKTKADDFITRFIAAAEDKQDMEFDAGERDGITLYTHISDFDPSGNVVIAHVGKFVYFSNTEGAIVKSASLKKADSLANDQNYKDGIAALNRDRLAAMYVNADIYSELIQSMGSEFGASVPLDELSLSGLSGFAVGVSVEDVGVRFDLVAVYDETQMSDFQKDVLSVTYLQPTADTLVPGDTFFFVDVNSSQNIGRYLEDDSPIYNQDVKESFELLEKEYDISIPELFDLLGGEFAVAVGPANDGLLVELGEVNLGFTVLASTSDETGFNEWFDKMLDVAFETSFTEHEINNVEFGDYTLQELVIQDSGEMHPALYYGADNGYIILGSSQGVLEDGLTGRDTLATNAAYTETWKAFPSGSIPYMYLDVQGLLDFIRNSDAGFNDLEDMEQSLRKIPTVALAINKPDGYVQSQTLIVFIK